MGSRCRISSRAHRAPGTLHNRSASQELCSGEPPAASLLQFGKKQRPVSTGHDDATSLCSENHPWQSDAGNHFGTPDLEHTAVETTGRAWKGVEGAHLPFQLNRR
jgi:hypothetical protein